MENKISQNILEYHLKSQFSQTSSEWFISTGSATSASASVGSAIHSVASWEARAFNKFKGPSDI